MKAYRGFDSGSDPLGKEPIIWFALDPAIAFGYAKHRKNPCVREFTISPTTTFDAGRSEQRMKVVSFMGKIAAKSRVFKKVEEQALALFDEIKDEFGDRVLDIHQFWFKSAKVVELIDLLGFDSIATTEDDAKTIGILRKHLSQIRS